MLVPVGQNSQCKSVFQLFQNTLDAALLFSRGGSGLWGLMSVTHTVVAWLQRWETLANSPDRSSHSSCKRVASLPLACGHQLGKQAESDNRSGADSTLCCAEGEAYWGALLVMFHRTPLLWYVSHVRARLHAAVWMPLWEKETKRKYISLALFGVSFRLVCFE